MDQAASVLLANVGFSFKYYFFIIKTRWCDISVMQSSTQAYAHMFANFT